MLLDIVMVFLVFVVGVLVGVMFTEANALEAKKNLDEAIKINKESEKFHNEAMANLNTASVRQDSARNHLDEAIKFYDNAKKKTQAVKTAIAINTQKRIKLANKGKS